MSSDLLLLENKEGQLISLSMNAHGFAFLTIDHSSINGYGYEEPTPTPIASFTLHSTPDGINQAKQISDALLAWIDHLKE